MHDQIIQNALFRYATVFLFKEILDELLLYADREFLSVYPQRIQLIEKHEFAVQQGVLRQYRRAGIGAFPNQVFQKGRRARIQVHNFFKIPRIDLFSGLLRVFRPLCPMALHRPDVVWHAERKYRFNLFTDRNPVPVLFQQKWQIHRCIIQYFSQFLPVELIRDDPVFTAGKSRQKGFLLNLRIQRRERMLRRRFWQHRLQKGAEILLLAGFIAAL